MRVRVRMCVCVLLSVCVRARATARACCTKWRRANAHKLDWNGAGVDCVSLDWTVSVDEARQRIGNKDMILQVMLEVVRR